MKDNLTFIGLVLWVAVVLFGISAGMDNYRLCRSNQVGKVTGSDIVWKLDHLGRWYRWMVMVDEEQYQAVKRSPSPAQAALAPVHDSSGPIITVVIDDRAMIEALNKNAPPPQHGIPPQPDPNDLRLTDPPAGHQSGDHTNGF
ncbi:MAG: hypothetical protein WCG99_00415 [Candidatus Berkelbacteria bacterium]